MHSSKLPGSGGLVNHHGHRISSKLDAQAAGFSKLSIDHTSASAQSEFCTQEQASSAPDPAIASFARLIRLCGDERDLSRGQRLEVCVHQSKFRYNRYLANLLVEMYGKCGRVDDALAVFDSIRCPNQFSSTILMEVYAQNGHLDEARDVFERMPEQDLVSWNAMIQAYISEGNVDEARNMFDRMPERNVVSWTSMIAMYSLNGHLEEARSMFDRMPERNVVSWNAMLAAYAQSGHLDEARNLFDRMSEQDVVSCTTLIAAYAQFGHLEEARSMFGGMPQRDLVSWTTILQACAQNAHLRDARAIFDTMPAQNLVSWTAIIHSYAQNGHGDAALGFFRSMVLDGVKPDEITFIGVLTACNHIGLVEDSHWHFTSIRSDYGLSFRSEHYCCMVDILGKAGRLHDAEDLIQSMPYCPDIVAWTSLLGACKLHRDVERARRVTTYVNAVSKASSPYVLLSSMYVDDNPQ